MKQDFTLTRRVQFAETDLAGVMHFANYYRWMEEIEHAFFRSRGLSIVQPHGGGTISWPRVRTECDYQRPVQFEDEVEMSLRVTRIGEKSITHEVTFTHNGEQVARGSTTIVCCRVDGPRFTPVPIPADVRASLQRVDQPP